MIILLTRVHQQASETLHACVRITYMPTSLRLMKFTKYELPLLGLVMAVSLSIGQTALAKDIKIGHLTYHTGEYGGFGEFFDSVADFSVGVINKQPPIGRNVTLIHEDIGTVGEARAAGNLLRRHKVDILLNPAHNYDSYRKTLLKRVKALNKPLLPSVHGGAINAEIGGNALEPLFRGSPMDTAQSAAAMLHIKQSGFSSVVIVHTTLEGHVIQKDAAIASAKKLGIVISESIEIQPDWTDYSSLVSKVEDTDADAVLMFTAPLNGGIFLKNAADAGFSWSVIGTSEWQEQDFVSGATSAALNKHMSVVFTASSHTNSPAWDYYLDSIQQFEGFEKIGDPANSYATQYYDLLVVTALAIEKAGKIDATKWTKAMYEVTSGDGEVVYTYEDGIELLREGKEINYDGVTGSMEYTDTGVVAGNFGIFKWSENNQIIMIHETDGKLVAELDQ